MSTCPSRPILKVRNAGANSRDHRLSSSDADSLYASGFVFGAGGNLEGIARVDWSTCSVELGRGLPRRHLRQLPQGRRRSTPSSHAHYCGNLPDGFPQTDPWTQHYGTAFTKAATGIADRRPATATPTGRATPRRRC